MFLRMFEIVHQYFSAILFLNKSNIDSSMFDLVVIYWEIKDKIWVELWQWCYCKEKYVKYVGGKEAVGHLSNVLKDRTKIISWVNKLVFIFTSNAAYPFLLIMTLLFIFGFSLQIENKYGLIIHFLKKWAYKRKKKIRYHSLVIMDLYLER